MKCDKCGTEYKLIRDQDDNLIRRICPCEVTQTCHQCKRGKVNHAQLTSTGHVANYACAKHGSPDAVDWLPPNIDIPSPKRSTKEVPKNDEPKTAHSSAKNSESKTTQHTPKNPHGKLQSPLPLREAHCEKCRRVLLTTLSASYCPGCGMPMVYRPITGTETIPDTPGGTAEIDGVYYETGPFGTAIIITGIVMREEPYEVCDVYVAMPRA